MTDVKAPALGSALAEAGIGFDVLEHERTDNAVGEARALGLRTGEVAKTIVVRTPDGDVRVVIASGDRVDMHRLRELSAAARMCASRPRRSSSATTLSSSSARCRPGRQARSGARRPPRRGARDGRARGRGPRPVDPHRGGQDLLRLADARVVDIVEG